MTVRNQDVCGHCGHRFRTSVEAGLTIPLTDDAALHRTRQFTLPPLPVRGAAAVSETHPAAKPERRGLLAGAAGAFSLALLGALAYFHQVQAAHAVRVSPVGIWASAPDGQAAGNARLRFIFGSDGGGSFSWTAAGPHPSFGQTPLRWRLAPDGRLILSISPPAEAGDAASGTLIAIFNSHPWLWRVDRSRHRLILGTLSLQETL